MHLIYCLIGLIVGIICSFFVTKLRIRKLYQQKILQENTLKKNTKKLHEYEKELSNYFNQNIELLDIIATNYRKLYQHMVKSSHILLNIENIKDRSSQHNMQQHYNDTIINDITKTTNNRLTKAPRDYPENNNQIR